MRRDPRPYTSYPLNYTGHPRVESLSDAAFRAFHEMNDYSRIHGLDGVIPEPIALKRWASEVLTELVNGIDDRPLVVIVDGGYFLRSYAEHQMTTGQVEALRAARAEAGRKGGEAKARARQAASNGVANASDSGKQILPQSQSQSQDFYSPSKSQSRSNRASISTDAIEVSRMTKQLAAQKGITSLRTVVDAIVRHTGIHATADEAFQLSLHLLDKAKEWPDAPQRYVTACIAKSPAEVQKHLYEEIGVAS